MKIKKILALILAFTLLFCFAACGKTDKDATTTLPPTTQTATVPTTIPATVPTTAPTTPPTTPPTTETTTIVPTTQTVPTDALSVFNTALLISKPASATYNRTAVTGEFESGSSAFDSFLNGFIGEETLTPQNATGLSADASAFTNLSAENFSSSNIADNGTYYTLTFNLKSIQVSATDKPAKGGYMYFMDGNEAMGAIQKANAQIIMTNTGTLSLSDGVLTATVDKTTGKLTSAKLTLKEIYHDDIDLSKFEIPALMSSLIPEKVSGTFEYDLTVNYTF